jgi:hypothetical protein
MVREVFNEEKGWLDSYWEGETPLSEIIDYIRRTKYNPDYPRRLKILTHSENAIINLNLEDLHTISFENKLSVERYEAIIDAFIVDAALVAALTTMYQQVSSVKGYFFKVFSTTEAAEGWLEGF